MQRLIALVIIMFTAPNYLPADEPILFISSFRSGDDSGIQAYRFDLKAGAITPLHRTTDVQNPFFMALSADGRFLYSIDAAKFGGPDDEFVAAYAIQRPSGELKRLNQQSSRGTASCYLDIDAAGKTVVVANYSTGSVAALPVQSDGSLSAAKAFVQHVGSSVDPKRQTSPNAHCIVISPDGRFALAADLGIDKIMIYTLNSQINELLPSGNQPYAALPPGSGPRHLTFHPNGKSVYVINELKNTIGVFNYTAETGELSAIQTIATLPADFSGISHTADLKITPDGKFLYGTNRGHNSIAIYRIAEDGRLNLISIDSSLGDGPQNLLITPDGHWLICANMPGNNVVIFAINGQTGRLTATGHPVSIAMPSCIRWLQ